MHGIWRGHRGASVAIYTLGLDSLPRRSYIHDEVQRIGDFPSRLTPGKEKAMCPFLYNTSR